MQEGISSKNMTLITNTSHEGVPEVQKISLVQSGETAKEQRSPQDTVISYVRHHRV